MSEENIDNQPFLISDSIEIFEHTLPPEDYKILKEEWDKSQKEKQQNHTSTNNPQENQKELTYHSKSSSSEDKDDIPFNPDFSIEDNFDSIKKDLEEFKKREAAKALEQNHTSTNNPQENQKELTYHSNSSSSEDNLEQVRKDIAGFLKEQAAKGLEQNPTSTNKPQV